MSQQTGLRELGKLSRALEALLGPKYIFCAHNADGRVHDGIVYGESDHHSIYGETGLLPALLYLAEKHYQDVFFNGDYAIAPEVGTLAPDFGLAWEQDNSGDCRTGYRTLIRDKGLVVSPAVILLFVYDVVEKMHLYAKNNIRDLRFDVEDSILLDEMESKKIVLANGLMDTFYIFLASHAE